MIRLNVFVEVSEDNRAKAIELSKTLVEYSLKDPGCIAYDIFESSTRKKVLMICETWKDAATLDAHMKSPHFVKLVPQIESCGSMKIEQFEF